MSRHRSRPGTTWFVAVVGLVTLAISVGCSSEDKAGPPTLPSGINRVEIAVQYMSGPATKTITDPVDIAALRESVNGLPRVGKGPRQCATDRGSWTLTLTGKSQPTTMVFDEKGCLEVRVFRANGTTQTRQGNEQLRTQLTRLVS